MTFDRGASAVVVVVPAAEPVVGDWRSRFDTSAAAGMPAHITLLYPFLAVRALTDAVVAELVRLCAGSPPVDVEFRRVGHFPGVLYLDPDPAEPFRRLTHAIAERWPEAPPYKGIYDEVVPHLTVADGATEETAAEIENDVAAHLPLHTRIEEAALFVFDGDSWRPRAHFPFQADPAAAPNRRASST